MSEWRSVWKVVITYANLADNGGYPRREIIARRPAELRRIVEWARRNPAVVGFPYDRMLERQGERPTACRNGHTYDGTSLSRARLDWTACACGGHMAYVCVREGCGDVRLDPAVYEGCVDTEDGMVVKARRRRGP
jgi:hypothetical protein